MILLTPLLEKMAEIVPSGIYLTNFSYQTTDNQIALNGWANWRENLIDFQESLEEDALFKEIEAPLSNLIKQRDIDFSFTLKLVLQP